LEKTTTPFSPFSGGGYKYTALMVTAHMPVFEAKRLRRNKPWEKVFGKSHKNQEKMG
jgi:hypothetical protein